MIDNPIFFIFMKSINCLERFQFQDDAERGALFVTFRNFDKSSQVKKA